MFIAGKYAATQTAAQDGSDVQLATDAYGNVRLASAAFDVTVTPTVTNGAYSAGDIVGGLMTFSNVAPAVDAGFVLARVQVAFKANITSSMRLILFSADPTSTTKTDNAAYSLAAGDAFKVTATLPINSLGGYRSSHGTPATYSLFGLNIAIKPASGTRDIYALLVDDTGVTLTSTSDVQVRLAGY